MKVKYVVKTPEVVGAWTGWDTLPHPQGLHPSHLNLSQTSAQRHRT